MAKRLSRATRANRVYELLAKRYPDTGGALNFSSPWQLLVAVILSAQCTDARVNMVTPELFRRWPGPAELAEAKLEEVEEVIHSTGFFRNKAKNIIACAALARDCHDCQPPRDMESLLKFPGVARKTANVVLFAAYGINAGLAVDTHVKRISHRLGLTESADPIQVEKDLMKLFPQEGWGDVNNRMVWFGRDVCRARKPDCGGCEMESFCPKLEPPKEKTARRNLPPG